MLVARGTPRVELVVIQPTPFCNINCSYCYLPNRDAHTVIELSTIHNLFAKLFDSPWMGEAVTLIWHAGEPLVLPVDFYRRAVDAIEALRPATVRLTHSFQTNGMLITPAWCDFIVERQVRLGVSIDGPKHLHDSRRLTRSGQGTFDKAMAGVRLLRQRAIPFHVISVLSRASMAMPEAMHDFYVAEGIENVCFNVEESEGDYVSDMFAASDAEQQFRNFLMRFWQISRASGKVRFIREIDSMLSRIFRPNEIAMSNQQTEPFAMLNVDCRGNVSTFSPELLGHKHADYNDFVIGNINTDTLDEMRNSRWLAAMQRDIDAGVAACRESCEYFSVCGGGAPANKLSENGSFRSTQTAYCTLTQIAAVDLILEAFDRLEQAGEGDEAMRLRSMAQAATIAMGVG
jgi:uncharacterized protein